VRGLSGRASSACPWISGQATARETRRRSHRLRRRARPLGPAPRCVSPDREAAAVWLLRLRLEGDTRLATSGDSQLRTPPLDVRDPRKLSPKIRATIFPRWFVCDAKSAKYSALEKNGERDRLWRACAACGVLRFTCGSPQFLRVSTHSCVVEDFHRRRTGGGSSHLRTSLAAHVPC